MGCVVYWKIDKLINKLMIGKTISAAFVLLVSVPAFAQTAEPKDTLADFTDEVIYSENKHKVVTNTFWDNWFISVGGGGLLYFGDHDRQLQFGEWISPTFDIAVGKWFSPEVGARLMYSGGAIRGATQASQESNGVHSLGSAIAGKPDYGYWLKNSRFGFFNIHADVLFNLNNIIAGYKEDRIYTISPYIGLGVMRAYKAPVATEFAGTVGLLNSFRVAKGLDINLDVRGALVADRFDGEVGGLRGREGEGLLSVALGVTYKFKERGWERTKTIIRHDNRTINDLRDQIEDLKYQNEALKKALAERDEAKVDTIIQRINVAAPVMVTFKIGKSNLSRRDRVSLGMLADVIKDTDESIVYTITGYADAGTGSVAINDRLSRERAEAVYDCLVNEYGVDADRLKVEYKGGVENMFYDDPTLSRAAITVGR